MSGQSFGKAVAQRTAQSKAQRLSRTLGTNSAPGSKLPSPERSPPPSPPASGQGSPNLNLDDIPLERLTTRRSKYGIEDETDSEDDDDGQTHKKKRGRFHNAARRLVRQHTGKESHYHFFRVPASSSSQISLRSGQSTPEHERDHAYYVPKPKTYNEGILSSLMRLYNEQGGAALSHPLKTLDRKLAASNQPLHSAEGENVTSPSSDGTTSKEASGQATPKHQKWYSKHDKPSTTPSVANLVSSSRILAQPTGAPLTKAEESTPPVHGKKAGMRPKRPRISTRPSSGTLQTIFNKATGPEPSDDEFKVHLHVADVLKRHQYLLKLCRALMSYGAPTHRLEEYMRMSARVLEVEGQFLYIPGCMIISFDDSGTHTTEVRIVRTAQSVHLGKLRDTHEIYKEVVHDLIDLDEAMTRLSQIIKAENVFKPWFLVVIYGIASMCVGPFAFGARPIDMPIAFFLGCVLGFLQLIIAPKSELYSNIFEITASVLTSFLARAFGSINNGQLFCFSALAQSSIALILPGYIVRKLPGFFFS